MKVDIKISSEVQQPYAVIYTAEVTKEIQDAVIALEGNHHVITALDYDKIIILNPNEVYMVRVENEQVILYGENRQFLSNKRLYQIAAQLGKDFIKISRFTIVNLKFIDSVKPSFNGLMHISLKNGATDYIFSENTCQLLKSIWGYNRRFYDKKVLSIFYGELEWDAQSLY